MDYNLEFSVLNVLFDLVKGLALKEALLMSVQ